MYSIARDGARNVRSECLSEEALSAYLESSRLLSTEQLKEIEIHLRECRKCREALKLALESEGEIQPDQETE